MASESQVPFKPNANLCIQCDKKYMAAYRKKNRQRLSQQQIDWKNANRERFRASTRAFYATPEGKAKHLARVVKTPRTWLGHLLSAIRKKCAKPGRHDPKSGPQRDFFITLDEVVAMWVAQNGRCKMTGMQMTHTFHDLEAASIDRIDSARGYTPDNIQLVCQWVNFAKRHYPNDKMITIIGKLRSS